MKKIICELICSPVGTDVSVSKYVKAAVHAIENLVGDRVISHPMGTVFEVDTVEEVLKVTKAAHEAILILGADRVVTQLRMDDRRDKDRIMEDKVQAIKS